jgi:ribonuclease J
MKIKVYRGTKEIGGTCVELTSQSGKTLWIDLGLPLSAENPDIGYAQAKKPDALLISHPHMDHYGLMEYAGPDTPVFIGQVSRDLINATKTFLNRPLLNGNFTIIEPWKTYPAAAGAFSFMPYLADHSSSEAFAFLINADKKRVFYSGDFRATGNKRILYQNLIDNPPENIDLLLLEGTMVERGAGKYPAEDDVAKAIAAIVKTQENATFVLSSAQNIDRFVSVFKACNSVKKQVIVDVYNAWVLEKVKQKSPGTPNIDWDEVRVFNHPSQMEKIKAGEFDDFRRRVEKKSAGNDVFGKPAGFVYLLRCPSLKLIDALRGRGKMNVIYSQWEGYLTKEHKTWFSDRVNAMKNDPDINFYSIHTSGHATMDILQEFARAINPKKIVPIHTEKPEKFKEEFAQAGIANVELWEDGKEYDV